MAKTLTPASDTRTRILDAAESLIAGNGFRNVSLRQITGAAEVNIAAVNYHFGSREGLIGQVLARVIRPINQQRLHLLDLAEERHRGPVPLEEILEALHRPVVAEMQKSPHQTPVYLRLAGRCLSEPPEHFSETLVELFREVIARFMAATKASLPHLDGASIFWRMHFSVGTMIYALTHEDRLPLFSDGIVEATDPEDTLRRLIEFTAACVNFCMSSGFCFMMSSMPGMADLNMVLVMCSMIALPPSWNSSLSSGAILALDLYLSCSSEKMSS
jgi:AcrR family transcriptional regulator